MTTRREFLRAGGIVLAGLAVPRAVIAAGRPAITEIRMRSDARGAAVWFDPVGLRVAPGDTVRWVLETNVHSTTAYHPANGDHAARIPAEAAPWDSGILTVPGASFAHRFPVPGVYDYYCTPHERAGMVGRIVVLPPGSSGRHLSEPPLPTEIRRAPSPAARAAFPPVPRIAREGVVRATISNPGGSS